MNYGSRCPINHLSSYNRSKEEEEKTKNVWLKGHHGQLLKLPDRAVLLLTNSHEIDIGCVTVLWSQPVGGLQILSPDGNWRWVKHIDNALVCLFAWIHLPER